MPTLAWIIAFGLAMSAIALVGSVTLVLPERAFKRLVLPLVALADGSLLGGTFFHLLPESVDELGNGLDVYAGLAGGFLTTARRLTAGPDGRWAGPGRTVSEQWTQSRPTT